jgi:DNA-binding transcriptional regulator YiaG
MGNHPNRSGGKHPAANPTPDDIRAAREAAGLTQKAAAALVLSNLRTWQKWEGGERKMHPASWLLFALLTGQKKLADFTPGDSTEI